MAIAFQADLIQGGRSLRQIKYRTVSVAAIAEKELK